MSVRLGEPTIDDPRGDPDHPVPQRVYQDIGFVPGPRTHAWGRS